MKKFLTAMVLCGLAFGMVACGGDDNDNCLNEDLLIIQEANKMDTALRNGAINGTEIDCLKYAENMATYLDESGSNLDNTKAAINEMKNYKVNSVLGALCVGVNSIKIISAAQTMKTDYAIAEKCYNDIKDGTDESTQQAAAKLSAGMQTLSTLDGWNNVMTAAAQEASKGSN